jgi:2-C-methyl-D-erythritol 2,4-cyclodiphosphate synthase
MARYPRVGQGVDVHPFDEQAGRLVLGGAVVPGETGLAGHSDGDVVLHAVCDALLGAAGMGDLGCVFGTDDPAYAGADSQVFLAGVLSRLADAGWAVGNLDCTLVAERPRLGEHRDRLHGSLALLLGVPGDRVNLKATGTDRLGALGRGEGIACVASALVVDRET